MSRRWRSHHAEVVPRPLREGCFLVHWEVKDARFAESKKVCRRLCSEQREPIKHIGKEEVCFEHE